MLLFRITYEGLTYLLVKHIIINKKVGFILLIEEFTLNLIALKGFK